MILMAAPLGLLFLLVTPAASLSLTSPAKTPETRAYFWPEPRGIAGSYSVSPYKAPRNLSTSLAWSWFNGGPAGKYSTAAHSGLVMDDEKSIYLSSTDGIRKFTSDGDLLWHWKKPNWRIPTLYKGAVYVAGNDGILSALSMETGKELWSKKISAELGSDITGVGVHDGVVVTPSHGLHDGGEFGVTALDASTGEVKWDFKVEAEMWNFMPMFTDRDSFIFQDRGGGAYHYSLKDGKRIWKAGYDPSAAAKGDFTDGLATVADGVVYTVHSDGTCCQANEKADLRAYDLSSGRQLWVQRFDHPANSQGAVGHLGHGSGLSERLAVVMPIGAQPSGTFNDYKSSIAAFDAKTGEKIWEWAPPDYIGAVVAGDFARILSGTVCLPNPYGSPSIDGRGTVYTGHFNGMIYAIRDDNGDNIIQDSEVSSFDTGAGFSHGGAVIAPGMMAIASCDGLYVFKG